MRIAYFTETFLPKIDGVVNTLCHLLEHLDKHGHESLLFAPSGAPSHYAGTPVVNIPARAFPLYPELKIASPFADFRRQLSEFKPDIVHVLAPFFLGASGLRSARQLGLPVVASYHTDIPGYMGRYGFRFLQSAAWSYLRKLHNGAALNLCPSQPVIDELAARGFGNLKLWSRGVDTELFSPARYSDSLRSWLCGGQEDAFLMLYVGRLAAEKRVDWLVSLVEAMPGARLAIVGDGPERRALEQKLADKPVLFTGYLRGPELAQAYAAADLFVFPSANETFGNVLLEAMASGLPVLTAAAGGPLDLVQSGETGLLFAPEDQGAFIDGAHRLRQDTALLAVMSQRCRSWAESRSWDAVMDLLLQDYARAAGMSVVAPVTDAIA